MGFTSHPVAPARLPSSRFELSLSVVRVKMGVNRVPGKARTLRISSIPLTSGMLMSVRIRLGLNPLCSFSSATFPFSAVSTKNPFIDSAVFRLSNTVEESSTTRIVFGIPCSPQSDCQISSRMQSLRQRARRSGPALTDSSAGYAGNVNRSAVQTSLDSRLTHGFFLPQTVRDHWHAIKVVISTQRTWVPLFPRYGTHFRQLRFPITAFCKRRFILRRHGSG